MARLERVTVPSVLEMKRRGERIAMLTAYDYPTARLLERAGVEVILVGDSLGMVTLGYDSTVPVTLEEMIHHVKAVVRGTSRALVVGDLPFGSYGESPGQAVRSATRLVKEGGCDAVKLEGGSEMVAAVEAVVRVGIPVVGHVGLLPQSAGRYGGFRVQGKTAAEARELLQGARDLQAAGAFMVVVEAVPAPVGEAISRALEVPVIGIGAGAGCDGQVLVTPDMLGLQEELSPRFLKRYANLAGTIVEAAGRYVSEVKEGRFPEEVHGYAMDAEEERRFRSGL
ncbi:3-methyl-2-oxobutanoate hydroxymethyltransferase [Rubrobacter taiwanensis]|uniref:3-methyl-2-oxobutanoate hydroxymethyltransferase n=1 Tax=Rubrobacter taiwanensis TaxID=185139 RepID=A0A4R1BAD2_9ACTN|nr:3-methyl-2-oxobutanoate hydroxymethyltransferase [Rubrobacter taiwanensis]